MSIKYTVSLPKKFKLQPREISFDRLINTKDEVRFALLPGIVFVVVKKTYNITATDEIENVELVVKESTSKT